MKYKERRSLLHLASCVFLIGQRWSDSKRRRAKSPAKVCAGEHSAYKIQEGPCKPMIIITIMKARLAVVCLLDELISAIIDLTEEL